MRLTFCVVTSLCGSLSAAVDKPLPVDQTGYESDSSVESEWGFFVDIEAIEDAPPCPLSSRRLRNGGRICCYSDFVSVQSYFSLVLHWLSELSETKYADEPANDIMFEESEAN